MSDWLAYPELWALFSSSFIASTLLPGGSEIYLSYLLTQEGYPLWLLVTVASVGNSLGGVVTWGMGWWIARRFPLKPLNRNQIRARDWLQAKGYPVLLFSWLPIIGDPLCLLSGWLRMHFGFCVAMIVLGKTARYGLLAYGVQGVVS